MTLSSVPPDGSRPSRLDALAGTGLRVLLLLLLAARVDRVGGRVRELPVLEGAAAGVGCAG
ncbi:hypothetical protein [Streptomyces sp. SD31]|uniref:hypothetical protein n=1 Tax=Streptomyces sp. SD31 TaxID=3452208 RepID=UPI003F8AA088